MLQTNDLFEFLCPDFSTSSQPVSCTGCLNYLLLIHPQIPGLLISCKLFSVFLEGHSFLFNVVCFRVSSEMLSSNFRTTFSFSFSWFSGSLPPSGDPSTFSLIRTLSHFCFHTWSCYSPVFAAFPSSLARHDCSFFRFLQVIIFCLQRLPNKFRFEQNLYRCY